jgi:hypothetical protein
MKYFLFKDEEEEINKGDKVRVLVRKYEPEFKEEVLEEFVLENFFYHPETKILVIFSPANFSEKELMEKIGDGEVIVNIEKNVT